MKIKDSKFNVALKTDLQSEKTIILRKTKGFNKTNKNVKIKTSKK